MKARDINPNSVLWHYLIAALWSSTDQSDDQGGEPLDNNYGIDDFSSEALEQAQADCGSFIEQAGTLLDGLNDKYVGHDFWLTRNRHGAGFWDGDYADDIGAKLTELSHTFREVYIYVGDDGQLYFE